MKQDFRSLCNVAYQYILEQIISYNFEPSEPIKENEICSLLGISRTPLREALRRLEAEGFVTKVPNRGTFVRAYTQEDIEDDCDIRILFELYALKNCVNEVSDEEIEQVKELLLAVNKDSSHEEYYLSDDALHSMITKYCRNVKMLSILTSLKVQLEAMQKLSAQTPNRLMKSRKEHLEILEAIERRDLPVAESLLRMHLENVKQNCVLNFQMQRIGR